MERSSPTSSMAESKYDLCATTDQMLRKSHEVNGDNGSEWAKPPERKAPLTYREKFARFPWKPFFLMLSLPLALTPVVVLATAAEMASESYLRTKDCYPNGIWNMVGDENSWRIMDSSYFFTPNLSFGKMTFTQVKVIDIAWDLVIGRGGQLLLAWVNYKVFNEWIVYHMELHRTSYKMYAAIAFQTTTLSALGVLGKEFLAFGETRWRRFFRWLAVLSMLLSTLYVLSFPTLLAALTGYITTYEAYIESYDKELIPFQKFDDIHYIVQDSYRIGNYTRPLIATHYDTDLSQTISKYIEQASGMYPEQNHDIRHTPSDRNTLKDFSSTWDEETTWNSDGHHVKLEAPSLNITTLLGVKLWWDGMDKPTGNSPIGKLNYSSFFTPDGRQGDVYNSSYIRSHGSCKPSETYQWGFSYIFLFMVSIFNCVWACIMVGMWFDTTRSSRMYRNGHRPGLLRSILDISAAIREEIGPVADELQEDDLRRALRQSGGALVVPDNELRVGRETTHVGGMKKRGWKRSLTRGSTF